MAAAFGLRHERAGDEAAISALTEAAFRTMPFASGTEAAIIKALRTAGDLTLSLVAFCEDRLVGHVAFSPVKIDGTHDAWFGLGPISVAPPLQRQGIGAALIERGLAELGARDAKGCALIGDPAYYRRFGFVSDGALTYRTVDPAYVQRLVLAGPDRTGELAYSSAFDTSA